MIEPLAERSAVYRTPGRPGCGQVAGTSKRGRTQTLSLPVPAHLSLSLSPPLPLFLKLLLRYLIQAPLGIQPQMLGKTR